MLSKDLVGIGASDELVLSIAMEKSFVLVTGDKKLALRAILHNQKIVFQHHNTKHRIVIEPKLIEYYPISQYIMQLDIVTP